MADLDEDAALTSSLARSHEDHNHEADDELPDFRQFAASSKSGQLPKRGEKDFEPHGTKHQDGILAASRQAMHDVLDYTRIHTAKQDVRAFYYGEEGLARDDIVPAEWRQGLEEDHVVVVESSKGPHFRTMGKMTTGKNNPALWLLPEEALFLVERGTMDLWWPGRSAFNGVPKDESQEMEDDYDELDEGIPMSLQEAYAMFIGRDGERGKVSLERYTVYANLKRTGYVVFRAPDWDPNYKGISHRHVSARAVSADGSPSVFTWLYGRFFAEKDVEHAPYGPLVRPGMYRSYNSIYRQIAVIPRHKPVARPQLSNPEDPYRVCFHLWKPTRIPTFAKSNPGIPDFRIAVVDARSSPIPSLTQATSLLESTPWNPPTKELEGPGIGKFYQRLKHGWRKVILAVIDQGVISYLELGEGAFGAEKLFENFDKGNTSNAKRGGRGGARGRGRGRGRGGRT